MAKPKAGGKTPAEPTPEIEQVDFTLTAEQSDQMRKAIALDEADPAEGRVHVVAAWTQIGATLGFDPETLILHAGIPAEGQIALKAKPAGEPAAPEVEPAPALSPEDQSIEDERAQLGSDEAFDASLDNMAAAVDDLDLASTTLVGDLGEGLMEVLKRMQKPFDAHSMHEKRQLAASVMEMAKNVARQAVDIVAADRDVSVRAIVDKIAAGDKVMVTLKLAAMPEDEMGDAIHNLYACLRKPVVIVLADSDRHMGRRRELIPPDQDELPFDAGRDGEAAEVVQAPSDDSDLAAGADDDEPEDEAPEGTHLVVDPLGSEGGDGPAYLLPPAEGDRAEEWTDIRDEAGVWPEAEAKELAASHDAEIEPKDQGE